MPTIVFLHAHPDDESIATGGTIARAAAEGWRVVVVIATNGEHGESPADLGQATLPERRAVEAARSVEVLGAARLAWLGYRDSGMTGWEQNHWPGAFIGADVDEAAERLLAIIDEEDADVLVGYDWHGNYGHPDHLQVHRVARQAAARRSVRLLEATMNRDHFVRMMEAQRAANPDAEAFDPTGPADDGNPMGEPETAIAWSFPVGDFAAQKRASIAAHASQVSDSSFFMQMPLEMFAVAFGTEWFIEPGLDGPPRSTWLTDEVFAGAAAGRR